MNNNMEENKKILRKQINNSGFFSLSLPAAFQRVFKKTSTTKEITDDILINNDGNDKIQPVETFTDDVSQATITIVEINDDDTVKNNPNENNEDDNNKLTELDIDNNEKSIDISLSSMALVNEALPLNINSTTNETVDDSKINRSCSSEGLPLKSILLSITQRDMETTESLDTSRTSINSRQKKNVTFNITVMSETYAPPSLFYEERSKQNILNEYIKMCEKYKIKPFDKLITQINEFELKTERELKIDLKGCRLDYKHCECLEEIFRYVRTVWLDISNTFLEDDGCVSICEMCEYYDTATHICLSGNTRISNRGWFSVSQLIQRSSCLEYLDLSRTIFTEQMLQILVRSFRNVSTLKTLHLEGCYLNGIRLQIILSAISSNKNIEELYLAENKISTNDANSLFDLIISNSNIRVLDLRNNSLQDNGLIKLSQGLLQQTSGGVEVLHLWNNSITSNGIQGFVHVLSLHPSLHTLNLGRNKIGDDGILTIKFNLIKNKRLQRLGLSNNRISNTGAVALAELIADSNKLLRLDLRENNIGLAGLIALSQAMQVNYSVFKLDFNRNIKVEPEMAELVTRLIDDVRICCLRNRQLAKGGPLDEILSLTSVLSDDHSITESLKILPPNQLPLPQKSADGSITSFWQLISRFTRAKNNANIANIISNSNHISTNDHENSPSNNDSIDDKHSTIIVDEVTSHTDQYLIDIPKIVEGSNGFINQYNNDQCYCSDNEEHDKTTTIVGSSCGCNIVDAPPETCDTFIDNCIPVNNANLLSTNSGSMIKSYSDDTLSRFNGVGRFSITRVVEKYSYKPNYPLGTHIDDNSSVDKSYDIQHQSLCDDSVDISSNVENDDI